MADEKPLNGDPKVIKWNRVELEAYWSTKRTCFYHGYAGGHKTAPVRIELKHMTKIRWSVTMSAYGLPTSMCRECDSIEEVKAMMSDCLDGLISLLEDGLISLLEDGLKLAKELRDAE